MIKDNLSNENLKLLQELGNKLGELHGGVNVVFMQEGVPHPTWVLEMLLKFVGQTTKMEFRIAYLEACLSSLLSILLRNDSLFEKSFSDEIEKEFEGIKQILETAIEKKKEKKSSIVIPGTSGSGL